MCGSARELACAQAARAHEVLVSHQAVVDERSLLKGEDGPRLRRVLVLFPISGRAIGDGGRLSEVLLLLG